ncbi:predicted protein, partial [Trichoplax adhaerens]
MADFLGKAGYLEGVRFPFKDGNIIITENSVYSCPNTPNSDDNSCYIKEIDLRKLSEISFGDKKLVDVIRELLTKEQKLFENMDIVAIRTSIASSLIEEIKQAMPDAKIPDKLLSIAEVDLTKCLDLLSSGVMVNDINFSEQDFDELSQLYDNNLEKFQALTSAEAADTYLEGGATFQELSQLYDNNLEKFQALTSAEAADTYLEGSATFQELSQLYEANYQKFEALTSKGAVDTYFLNGKVTFQELSQLYEANKEKFEALTSLEASDTYSSGSVSFQELSQLYDTKYQKFEALTSVEATYIYYSRGATFEELSQLYDTNQQKFKYTTIAFLETDATFKELRQLYDADLDKFKALTSQEAAYTYKA